MNHLWGRIVHSFLFIVDGFAVLRRYPDLWKWVYIPVAINLLLFFALFSFGLGQIVIWTQAVTSWLISPYVGFWYFFIYYPLLAIFFFAFSVATLYVVFILSTIIAAPFNSLLAEHVLIRLQKQSDQPFQFWPWLKLTGRMFFLSLIKAVIFLVLGLMIFVFSLIPILNLISVFFVLLIIVYDFADYSFEAMGWGLRQRFRFFWNHISDFAGMAFFLSLTGLLPGLTLLLLPFGVVGVAQRMVLLLKEE